jgi:2-polyprenyl-3-methyl-5-hydroxy-6-metoxy-1,4-benzoquinol methylase
MGKNLDKHMELKDMYKAEIMPCPVCNSWCSEEHISKRFEDYESTWLKCNNKRCGAYFMFPVPAQQELNEYYRQNYRNKKSPGTVSHAFRYNEENKNIIFNEYNLSLSDTGISIEMLYNKKILDYGCANGFFFDFLTLHGCLKEDLYGFDIAEDLLEEFVRKGYNILSDTQMDHFDYIFLWDVLEHISYPQMFLQDIKSYLKKGGKFIVQTPRVGILAEMLGSEWEHFLPLEHVILYTRESLVKLFNDAGFVLSEAKSFGANASSSLIPQPYKRAFDYLAKYTDNGSTQIVCFIYEK